MKTLFFLTFLFTFLQFSYSQSLNLNDLITIHNKESDKEITTYLKLNNKSWSFDGFEEFSNTYPKGSYSWSSSNTNFVNLVSKGFTLTGCEVLFMTNNKNTVKQIMNDIEKNKMNSIDGQAIYMGKNYVISIVYDTKDADILFIIRLMTKEFYYNNN